MTTTAEQKLADWRERAVKLRAEIAERRAALAEGQPEPKVLTNLVGSLATAEARIVSALAAVAREQRKAEKAQRHARQVAEFERRLDKIAAAAPATQKRWDHDRKEEPKRLDKRKKTIAKRITKDRGAAPDPFAVRTRRPRNANLPIEAETFPSGPIVPYEPQKISAEINRPGLMPEDYRLIDVAPAEAAPLPEKWTPDYVGQRFADAHATCRSLPATTRPKEFGTIWPEYQSDFGELVHQAGAGTLDFSRVRRTTSAADLRKMRETFGWIMEFLTKSHPVWARALNRWAFRLQFDGDDPDHFVIRALEFIAKKLNAKGVKVT